CRVELRQNLPRLDEFVLPDVERGKYPALKRLDDLLLAGGDYTAGARRDFVQDREPGPGDSHRKKQCHQKDDALGPSQLDLVGDIAGPVYLPGRCIGRDRHVEAPETVASAICCNSRTDIALPPAAAAGFGSGLMPRSRSSA